MGSRSEGHADQSEVKSRGSNLIGVTDDDIGDSGPVGPAGESIECGPI